MSTHDKRDAAVEQLLRRSLNTATAETDACLDAEAIAAWLDGGLRGDALRAAEAHVAGCARCQVIVGVMARTEPVTPAVVERGRRYWFRWLVPLTAATAALVLWVAIPRQPQGPVPVSEQLAARTESAPTLGGQAPAAPVAPPQLQETTPSAFAASAPPTNEEARRRASASPSSRSDQNAAAAKADQPTALADTQASDRTAAQERAAANSAPTDALAVGAAQSASSVPPAAAPAAPPPAQGGSAGALAPRLQPMASAAIMAVQLPVVLTSPDQSIRWRTGPRLIQRSTDGGATWEEVYRGPVAITAGSVASASVVWFVGSDGVVLRATDGRTFIRLPFPEAVSLVDVRAVSDRSAVVTAQDGRGFATDDGGVRWERR